MPDTEVATTDYVTVPRDEFLAMMQMVTDIHKAIGELHDAVGPAVQSLQAGGIMGLLTGLKRR